jgi:hypothetical protein
VGVCVRERDVEWEGDIAMQMVTKSVLCYLCACVRVCVRARACTHARADPSHDDPRKICLHLKAPRFELHRHARTRLRTHLRTHAPARTHLRILTYMRGQWRTLTYLFPPLTLFPPLRGKEGRSMRASACTHLRILTHMRVGARWLTSSPL